MRESRPGQKPDISAGGHDRTPAIILSLAIAFVGIVFLSFFAHWYEVGIMNSAQPPQIIVNALPPMVLFMLVLVVLGLNPLLKLISRSLVMGAREIFMITTLWLVTGVICYVNFTTPVLMVIGNVNSSSTDRPILSRVGFRDYLNPRLFLSSYAANEYHLGKSPDGRTRIPPVADSVLFRDREFRDIGGFAVKTLESGDVLSKFLMDNFSAESLQSLRKLADASQVLSDTMVNDLNSLIEGPMLYEEGAFSQVALTQRIRQLIEIKPEGEPLERLNRLLLEAVYPAEINRAREGASARVSKEDIRDLPGLAAKIHQESDSVSRMIHRRLSQDGVKALNSYFTAAQEAIPRQVRELNELVNGPLLMDQPGLKGVTLSGPARSRVNRLMLEISYPDEIRRSAIPVSWPFVEGEIEDFNSLALRIAKGEDAISSYIRGRFGEDTLALAGRASESLPEEEKTQLKTKLLADLNKVVNGQLIYDPEVFSGIRLDDTSRMLLNRTILEEGYSREITRHASAIPWRLWWGPLSFWTPFMLLVILFSASLVRMMHRQWSQHELLTYPLAEVIDSFLKRDKGGLLPDAFRARVFWIGFIGIFLMYAINGLQLYFPLMIRIPTMFYHIDIVNQFEFLARYSGREAYALFRGFIYPFIIAIAVLLPTDLSLTSWLGFVMMVFGTGFYFFITGEAVTDTDTGSIQTGMYFALGAVIILIGRREYANIFKHALIFKRSDNDMINRAAWACRLFILSFAGLVVLFIIAGLDWFMALTLVLSFGLTILLVARLTAETGIPWLVNMSGLATSLPLRVLGAAALGPQALAIFATVGMPLDSDFSNSIPTQETIYGKNREKHGGGWITGARFNLILSAGILLAISASIFFHLWNNYTFGARREQVSLISNRMGSAANEINRLQVEGLFDKASEASGLRRLGNFEFDSRFWQFFVMGAVVVIICALMRLRFSWWPFHPLPLLFINTWTMSRLYTSIFIGWVIKSAILRIWGGKTFSNMKPFFIGVIVGQATILGVWVVVGAIYFLVKDIAPPRLIYMWL